MGVGGWLQDCPLRTSLFPIKYSEPYTDSWVVCGPSFIITVKCDKGLRIKSGRTAKRRTPLDASNVSKLLS